MIRRPVIAVDLDGTIAKYNDWQGPDHIGDPLPKASEGLMLLKKAGFKILIFTTRTNPLVNKEHIRVLKLRVERYLEKHDIPYDDVYAGPGKPLCDLFLDDRAITFVNWDQAVKDIIARSSARFVES